MATPFLKNFLLLQTAFALLLFPLLAAPEEDSMPPPSPSIGKVVGSPEVVRGGECEIVLRGIVMPRETAEFKIHKGPRHGSLEGPRKIGEDSAVYIYRHNGKKGTESDRIDFKIKTGSNNTWGRLTATIAIEEPPSQLELNHDQLEFGQVPIGQTRSNTLRVRNAGGGVLSGTLATRPPWAISESAAFELREGQSREFQVVFMPDGSGQRQGRLDVLAGDSRQAVVLQGEGVYRFDAPERVSPFDSRDGMALKIPLTNRTAGELTLSAVAPAPLLGEDRVVLPANGSATLFLDVEKRHYTEKFAEVALSDGSAVRTVRVELPSPPALLEWAAQGGVIDLGEVSARTIPRPEFELRNRGATAATVRIRADGDGFALAGDQEEEFDLLPGESALVKTVWRLAETPGLFSGSLTASHGGLDHPLRVKIHVVEASAEPEAAPSTASAEAAPSPSPDPQQILSEAEQRELKLRRPFDIETRDHGGVLEVTWKYSGPKPVLFWLEKKVVERAENGLEQAFERRLKVPDELPQLETMVKWVPVPPEQAAIHESSDGTWRGFVHGLEPGYQDVRIATRTPPDGPRIDYSGFVVRVFPPPPNPLWKWISAGVGIFCLLYLLRNPIRRLLRRDAGLE